MGDVRATQFSKGLQSTSLPQCQNTNSYKEWAKRMEYYLAMKRNEGTLQCVDEFWKHAASKMPVTKDHRWNDSIPMQCPQREHSARQKVDEWWTRAEVAWRKVGRQMTSSGCGGFSLAWWRCFILFIYLFIFVCFCYFFGPLPRHMEVPRLWL